MPRVMPFTRTETAAFGDTPVWIGLGPMQGRHGIQQRLLGAAGRQRIVRLDQKVVVSSGLHVAVAG